MAAIEKFEATEANLVKLERLWGEITNLIPTGISFGSNSEYEDCCRSYALLLNALPKIDSWKPISHPSELNTIAESRFDVLEFGDPSMQITIEDTFEEPGRELREYRFRLNNKRRALIREALIGLIDSADVDLREIRQLAGDDQANKKIDQEIWAKFRSDILQIEVLLGSSVKKTERWNYLHRHMNFGFTGDLHDIENFDWPQVKAGLRAGLYGTNDPLPVDVDDLSSLVNARPKGQIATQLSWGSLNAEDFERLMFSLISDTPGYENPKWFMQTNAPDRGRDLSVTRVTQDGLAGTVRQRVVIQCKHWLSNPSCG